MTDLSMLRVNNLFRRVHLRWRTAEGEWCLTITTISLCKSLSSSFQSLPPVFFDLPLLLCSQLIRHDKESCASKQQARRLSSEIRCDQLSFGPIQKWPVRIRLDVHCSCETTPLAWQLAIKYPLLTLTANVAVPRVDKTFAENFTVVLTLAFSQLRGNKA